MPTVAALIGAELPEHKIDGKDIRPLLFAEPGARSPHEVFYGYYAGGQLQTVRDRRFKLHLPHRYRTLAGRPGGTGGSPVPYDQAEIGLELFDMKNDVGETINVADQYPEAFQRLGRHAESAREDLGDKLTDRTGSGIREPGRLGEGDARLEW